MALIDTFVFIRGSYGIPVELLDAGDVRILEHQGLIQITFGGAAVLSSAGGFRLYDINEGRVGIEYCPAVRARIGLLETLQILRINSADNACLLHLRRFESKIVSSRARQSSSTWCILGGIRFNDYPPEPRLGKKAPPPDSGLRRNDGWGWRPDREYDLASPWRIERVCFSNAEDAIQLADGLAAQVGD